MGILYPDLSPKPAFFAFQAAIAAYRKPLVVSSTSPSNGSQQVQLNPQVHFSRGVNRAKAESTVVMSPSADYQIRIPGVAVGVIGGSLDGDGNGVVEGSPVDDFALSFGSFVDKPSVESAFSISPSVGGGYFTWDRQTVTVRLFGFFRPGTFYVLKVENTARDVSGFRLDGNGNGQADSLDDFVLYFLTTGKGSESVYPMTGKFPFDFFGASAGAADTAEVALPDTVQTESIHSGALRLVTKGVNDTTEVHIFINGTGPLLLSQQAVGGDNSVFSELPFAGSILKAGRNDVLIVHANNMGGSRSGFEIVPMALVVSYVTGVWERAEVPDGFALMQNYPNPFNSQTTIRYDLSTAGWATLRVFDVLGREIGTLVNEEKPVGTYKVVFDPAKWNPLSLAPLSSGEYFYRLQVRGAIRGNDVVQTKAMVFLR